MANAPASKAAVEGVVSGLGGECPGVLAGAPHETPGTFLGSPEPSRSTRQNGESTRELRQQSDLEGELSLALELPRIEADRQAALAFAHTVKSLRWSNSAVTALEHTDAGALEWILASSAPAVCADMKAWVASDYRTLSPATKILIGEREAIVSRPLLRVLRERTGSVAGSEPLLPYEGSREKALARKTADLQHAQQSALESPKISETKLQVTLGLISEAQAEMQTHEGRPKGSVEIGHGRTAVGDNYTVWFEPQQPGTGTSQARCQISVGVYEHEANGSSSSTIEIVSGPSQACLSHSHPQAPSVQCRGGEGHLTIEAQTLPRARSVRLRLSDGRQIVSRVAIVPAKLGGPAGFYYQVVRGPSPIPVSLTEVDAHGKALRIVKLPRTANCVRHSPKGPPRIVRTIASGTLPQGPSFSITGERTGATGKTHFELDAEVETEQGLGGFISSSDNLTAVGAGRPPKPSPFVLQTSTGCQPHEYAILYGVLTAPTDTVLARTSSGLQPFQQAHIPANLHAHGTLAYIPLSTLPSEVLVRTPSGKIVFTENLSRSAREATETCEGEAEAPG